MMLRLVRSTRREERKSDKGKENMQVTQAV